MIVFLGGPIQYAINIEQQFNSELKELILTIINYLSDNGVTVFSAHIEEDFGASTEKISNNVIGKRDFEWMVQCDKYIAILPSDLEGNLMRSDGTHIELGWASALNKKIYIICSKSTQDQMSKVLQGLNAISSVEYIDIQDSNDVIQIIATKVLES